MGLRLQVAIVDHDDKALSFCQSVLEGAGHGVILFGGTDDLLANAPWLTNLDVLVLDASFHDALNATLIELKQQYPFVGIVLMTGDTAALEHAIVQGHLPLVKPFAANQLLSSVEDLAAQVRKYRP